MKHIEYEEWEIISTYEMQKFIMNKGFNKVNKLVLFEEGKPYCKIGGRIYVELEDEEYEKMGFRSKSEIMLATQLLAEFHSVAQGFEKPTGIKIKTEWGRLVEKYKVMALGLNKYYKNVHQGNYKKDRFVDKTIQVREQLERWCEASIRIFRSEAYLKLLEASMRNKEIGIVSIDETSIAKADGTRADRLSEMFDAGYNMKIEDIAKLIKKCAQRQMDWSSRELILRTYKENARLNHTEILLINAIAGFPYDCIKTIQRYEEKKHKEEELFDKFCRSCNKELEMRTWGMFYGL